MADTETQDQDTSTGGGHGHHPGVAEYVEIGVILAVLTAMEVALYFANIIPAVTVPALIALTIAKFALVVMWFMHLRFDSKLFRRLLWAGLLLAAALYAITIILTL